MTRPVRWRWWVASLFVVVPVAALLALPRFDWSGFAAERLSARLGRAVTVGSMHVTPGRLISFELREATVSNIDGGSAPHMLRLSRLTAWVEPLSLLRGAPVLRRVELDGLALLLERTADGRRNWRFGGDPAGPALPRAAEAPDRSGLPLIGDLRAADLAIVYRTRSGNRLDTNLAQLTAAAPHADAPLVVTSQATYQGVPLSLEGELGTPRALQAGRDPVRMAFTIAGADTRLSFDGYAGDPFNFDRLAGRLDLQANTLVTLGALVGAGGAPAVAFEFVGDAVHDFDLWRLTGAEGSFDAARLEVPLLELAEGTENNVVTAQARLARLNLDRLAGGGGSPSLVLGRPDPHLRLDLGVAELLGLGLRATDLRLAAALTHEWLAVEEVTATAFGSRVVARGRLEPASGDTGRILADASVEGGTLDDWRRAAGIRAAWPLSGTTEAHAHIDATGATLDAALDAGRIGLVVGLSGGRISREVVEAASLDVRALFRTARGTVPLTCGLAVLSVRGGRGELAPLRLRAATGTIVGLGGIDLRRGSLNVVVGTERDTTGGLALDVPVRLSGSIRDPSVGLGAWPAGGRATAALAGLPVQLRDRAEQNPCYR